MRKVSENMEMFRPSVIIFAYYYACAISQNPNVVFSNCDVRKIPIFPNVHWCRLIFWLNIIKNERDIWPPWYKKNLASSNRESHRIVYAPSLRIRSPVTLTNSQDSQSWSPHSPSVQMLTKLEYLRRLGDSAECRS